jgi:hypothetical protein
VLSDAFWMEGIGEDEAESIRDEVIADIVPKIHALIEAECAKL